MRTNSKTFEASEAGKYLVHRTCRFEGRELCLVRNIWVEKEGRRSVGIWIVYLDRSGGMHTFKLPKGTTLSAICRTATLTEKDLSGILAGNLALLNAYRSGSVFMHADLQIIEDWYHELIGDLVEILRANGIPLSRIDSIIRSHQTSEHE